MDAPECFAALYGEYAKTCLEMGVRPLPPEDVVELLAALDGATAPTIH
jgi:hypothetical protein